MQNIKHNKNNWKKKTSVILIIFLSNKNRKKR